MRLIGEAADTLRHGGERTIRVMGVAPGDPADTVVDIVLPEAPMFASMLDYSGRILVLSIILAFVVAGLVYISLHWLMVLPLGRMTDSLVSFRRAPEDAAATVRVSRRRDEIGVAQRELQVMQRRVRAALRQRARLAAVGTGVAKINHDLRNMLATAAVLTDRLATAPDPEVQRLAHPLLSAIDRAIALCTHTLSFATGRLPAPKQTSFALAAAGGRNPGRAPHRRGVRWPGATRYRRNSRSPPIENSSTGSSSTWCRTRCRRLPAMPAAARYA